MRLRKFQLIWMAFFMTSILHAQDSINLKSIDPFISSNVHDTIKIKKLIYYCSRLHNHPDLNLKLANKLWELAEKSKKDKYRVKAYAALGDAYWYTREYSKAIEFYYKQLELAEKIGDKPSIARAYYNIGWMKSVQNESFEERIYLIRALKIFEQVHDTGGILEVYNGLAGLYGSNIDLSKVYIDSASYYYRNLIYFSEVMQKKFNIVAHFNYASFLTRHRRLDEAGKYIDRCIEEAIKQKDSANYALTVKSKGRIMILKGKDKEGIKLIESSIPLLKKTKQIEALVDVYVFLHNKYSLDGNYRAAYDALLLENAYQDSSKMSINSAHLEERDAQYQIEKREMNIKRLEQENEISKLKNQQNKYITYGLGLVAVLVIIIMLSLYRSNRVKQEANHSLSEKNKQIEEQKKVVEQKNLEVTQSINYAKRIQEAILPAKELKFKLFPEAFILFQPKDIVSGDFYWYTEKNGIRLIAAIDCTGHGVPGAFMSLIGNTYLQEAVNERGITCPSDILNRLRNNVITSLKQSDVIESTKDGMDMALLAFNDKNSTVDFAGANNPLWMIRDGVLTEYKGDKKPIGYYSGEDLPFMNHTITYKKGDLFYLFTDGMADQFGGPKARLNGSSFGQGKKFKYKQLQDTLISLAHLPMHEQEELLMTKFQNWKGSLEQVDDVCVIGIRV